MYILYFYYFGKMGTTNKRTQGKISTSAHSSVPKVGLKNKSHQLGVGHSALKTVVIPRGLQKIGARVFYGCTNLSSLSTTNSYQDKIIIPGTV
jgi:hypothetical protein